MTNNQLVVVSVEVVSVLLRWSLLLLLRVRTYVCLGELFEKRDDPQARVAFLIDLPA